jgi:KDO2-lipid IV(A) lauroyltransferase
LLVAWLPRRAVLGLSRSIGSAAFRLCGGLRRIALANLEVAFGAALPEKERERTAKESFRTAALVFLDLFWFGFRPRARLAAWVSLDGLVPEIREPGPAVAVTAHLGNWEILGQAVSMRAAALASVAAPLPNAVAGGLISRLRASSGLRIAPKRGAVRALVSALRAGGKAALLLDQNVLPRQGGVFVEFFGLPVPVSKAAHALAARTGAPICYGYCVAEDTGRYRVVCLPAFRAEKDGDTAGETTQRLARLIEASVREHPGQWLWMYKRWKYIPPGSDGQGFPFYARPPRAGER